MINGHVDWPSFEILDFNELRSITFKSNQNLIEILKKSKNLEKLNLNYKSMNAYDFEIFQHITPYNNLTYLDISNNEPQEEGLRILCKFIKKSKIETLILQNNAIYSLKIVPLTELMMENETIKTLDLCSNHLDDIALKNFSESIKKNKKLEKLFFGFNKIGDEGMKSLCESLKKNACLKEIDLRGNDFQDVSIELFLETLKLNKSIEKINVDHNEISSYNHEIILFYVQSNIVWKPKIHNYLHISFKKAVFCFLLSFNVVRKNSSYSPFLRLKFPKFVLFEIFKSIDRKSFFPLRNFQYDSPNENLSDEEENFYND